jgi:type I restriction enzyme M protein
MDNISKLETDLWDAADNLRANSKLTSSEYCIPVLGVIFLRHATNRYNAVIDQIEADKSVADIQFRADLVLIVTELLRVSTVDSPPGSGNLPV